MKSRVFLILCLAILWVGQTASFASPNVLLIITDDQGYGDFSIHGNPHLKTPNIDRLGASGVRFERFYVNSFCAPTRAALLTGRYPVRTGCHGVTHNREAVRPSEVTLAEALKTAGYRTACIGKWHNGEQHPYTPPGQGFDEFFGFNNGHWNNYFDATLLRGTQPEKTQGYISDVLTDDAIRFIRRSAEAGQPFFCYLSYNAPHSPYQVPDPYYEKFRGQGHDEVLSAFYGMCENIDDNVGRLLGTLEKSGLTKDTLVLFLTDNGGTAGVKTYNAGMRGGKTSVHEGGSRVPLFMHWPAAKWQPHVATPIVSHIDLYPTVLDLCGVTPPEGPAVDGISLRPLLEKEEVGGWPERLLFTHNPIDETNRYPGAVRSQRYRLVREIKGRSGGSAAVANDASAQPWQLYDMLSDPGQKKDIAKKHPEIVKELSARYEAWIDDTFSEGLRRFPLPVGHAAHNPVELHAPQAYYTEPLHYASGPGFSNDWLTGWTDGKATVWFDAEAVSAGTYEAEIAFACAAEDAGSRIRLRAGAEMLEADVPSAPPVDIPLPHRDEKSRERYRNRDWAVMKLGMLKLEQGPVKLELEALSKPGGQVLDLKHLRLKKVQ